MFLRKRFPQWTSLSKDSRKCQDCSSESQRLSAEEIEQRAASEKVRRLLSTMGKSKHGVVN